MKKQGNKGILAVIIMGAVFLVGGVVMLLVGLYLGNGVLGFIGGILGISGVIILIAGIVGRANGKTADANIANPATLAHKTYGGGGDFVMFTAIPDRKAQTAKNAAVNALGAATMVFLGAGVFSYGKSYLDVFVSPDEIVTNDKNTNRKFADEKFRRIYARQSTLLRARQSRITSASLSTHCPTYSFRSIYRSKTVALRRLCAKRSPK